MNVAFLTIGQSPRHDMADPIEESLPAGTTVVHSGLLDGLSRPEIEAAYGDGGAGQGLITRLADGSSVTMRVEAVEEGLRTKVFSELSGEGIGPGQLIEGKFVGGSGRYVGISGEYSFKWKRLGAIEGNELTGRVVGLSGWARLGSPSAVAPTTAGGPK